MKKRQFIKANTEKLDMIQKIKYLKFDIESKQRVIKRLFERLKEKNSPRYDEILEICTSFVSGFDQGVTNDGLDLSRTPHAQRWLGEAYRLGYNAGQVRFKESQKESLS